MNKVKLPKFKCKRCGHQWMPRKEQIPICCGKCKSPYWNTKKVNWSDKCGRL